MTEPRRDRYGRYLLPDPITGEERAWTRATTMAKTLEDTFGLQDWQKRMVAKGVATNDSLRALAAALPLDTGKKQLNEVARDAIDHAGGGSGRNYGNALHEWTAQVDRGETPDVPPPWDADVLAYQAALAVHGIQVHPDLVERIVCVPELAIAGTFDRIVTWHPETYVLDVKTSTGELSYSWGGWAMQMAIYARAEWVWDGEGWARLKRSPNPADGIVAHVPVGTGTCDLYLVDLVAGWEAVQLAADVRDWRKRDNLHRPIGTEMLGRSPVQPVLDLETSGGSSANGQGDEGPGNGASSSPTPDTDAPADQTTGVGQSGGEVRRAGDKPLAGTPAPAPVPDTPTPAGVPRVTEAERAEALRVARFVEGGT